MGEECGDRHAFSTSASFRLNLGTAMRLGGEIGKSPSGVLDSSRWKRTSGTQGPIDLSPSLWAQLKQQIVIKLTGRHL